MSNTNKQIIIGVDPGFAITGYSIIKKSKNELSVIDFGVITTSKQKTFNSRLLTIHDKISYLIKKYKPNVLAIEDIFFYKNAKTAIKVGESRGAIIITAIQNKIPVYNFTPLQVKQSVTGYGRAEKKQIQKMIKILFNLRDLPQPDDAADALAVAYCCSQSLTLKKHDI